MKKLILFTLFGASVSTASFAQFSEFEGNVGANPFTLSSDKNTLQIGGRVSFYDQYRILKAGNTNLDKNGFEIKDCDLDILGKTASKFTYEFHVSLVDIITAAATQNTNNPANPGFKAAYLQYNGWPVHIKFGFDKLPFSQSNLCHEHESPSWGHPNLTGGDLFSRRDLGITLNSTFWKQRINLYAGAYSGMGENFFEYGNDASGTFEYVGRAEFSYPSKMNLSLMDEENSPIPHFRVGVNARYEDKTQPSSQPAVSSAYPDAIGAYGIRMINGQRTVYGYDAIVKFKGFAATFEADMLSMKPSSQSDPLFNGTPASFNKGVVNAGGFTTGLNYTYQPIKSAIYVNYEYLNTNDLADGYQEWLSIAYAYKVNFYNSVFKVEYYIPLKEDAVANPLKYTGQIRAGYQIVF